MRRNNSNNVLIAIDVCLLIFVVCHCEHIDTRSSVSIHFRQMSYVQCEPNLHTLCLWKSAILFFSHTWTNGYCLFDDPVYVWLCAFASYDCVGAWLLVAYHAHTVTLNKNKTNTKLRFINGAGIVDTVKYLEYSNFYCDRMYTHTHTAPVAHVWVREFIYSFACSSI